MQNNKPNQPNQPATHAILDEVVMPGLEIPALPTAVEAPAPAQTTEVLNEPTVEVVDAPTPTPQPSRSKTVSLRWPLTLVALLIAIAPWPQFEWRTMAKIVPSAPTATAPTTTAFWFPHEADAALTAIQTSTTNARNVRVLTSVFGINAWAKHLANIRKDHDTQVTFILDGTAASRSTNLKNQGFFRKAEMGCVLTMETHNLHCILIDETDGWLTTGPLNSKLVTTPGRIYRLTPKEAAILWNYTTALLETKVAE